jgi:UDP-N-acetyl-D-glucosamine dehydrogenase
MMTVGIVGLGYVGLPLAVGFAEAGHKVVGYDVDSVKVSSLREGRSHVEDIPDATLARLSDYISYEVHFSRLSRCDIIVICVPTPLTPNREPDLTALHAAVRDVASIAQPGQLISLESTTYPGCTREVLVPALEAAGLTPGADVAVAFSPERIDPGRTDYTLRTTPKIVGGLTRSCLARATDAYAEVCDHLVPVSSLESAELAKLLENVYRSVNIALVNELAVLADRMDIDVWEVVDAAASKPYGFMRFEPGPGMGGHCLPVDPFYLSWQARRYDLSAEFIELAGKVNQQMPHHCVQKVERALNDVGKAVRGSTVALLGVSYKSGVGDVRESPALKMIRLLKEHGAEVSYHDEYVPELKGHDLKSEPLSDTLDNSDVVVIVTRHPGIDYVEVAASASLLVDLRGVTRTVDAPNIVRL